MTLDGVAQAVLVAVAWPILRARNARAHDHGEGFVTALATLVLPFVGFVMSDGAIGSRRVDAVLGALALPCLALVIVLVVRVRRLAMWHRAKDGDEELGIVAARGDEDAVRPLWQAFPGEHCIVHKSVGGKGGYREGGVRIPLARVPSTIPWWGPIRMALPVLLLVYALLAFLGGLEPSRPLFMPRTVSEYAGGRTEVSPAWQVEDVGGLVIWQVRLGSYRDERDTLIAVDEHGALVDGAALFTRLAAAGTEDDVLAGVARLTLLHSYTVYIANRPPQWSRTYRAADVAAIVRKGRDKMLPLALTDAEIGDVLAHLRSLGAPPPPPVRRGARRQHSRVRRAAIHLDDRRAHDRVSRSARSGVRPDVPFE